MRFSLTTLLLVAFWIAALMLVWAWRNPWVEVAQPVTPKWRGISVSPDKCFDVLADGKIYRQLSNSARVEHASLETDQIGYFEFIDNSTIAGVIYPKNHRKGDVLNARNWRRRFPEWWWGHFYRPEVWLALGLTGALGWRALRRRRNGSLAG